MTPVFTPSYEKAAFSTTVGREAMTYRSKVQQIVEKEWNMLRQAQHATDFSK